MARRLTILSSLIVCLMIIAPSAHAASKTLVMTKQMQRCVAVQSTIVSTVKAAQNHWKSGAWIATKGRAIMAACAKPGTASGNTWISDSWFVGSFLVYYGDPRGQYGPASRFLTGAVKIMAIEQREFAAVKKLYHLK